MDEIEGRAKLMCAPRIHPVGRNFLHRLHRCMPGYCTNRPVAALPIMTGMRRPAGPTMIAVLVLTAGCFLSATAPGRVDEEVVLAPGQSTSLANGSIRIEFHGVSSDSRCPADVECVQAGDAVVQVSVTAEGRTEELEFHTASPEPARHGDLLIELVQLTPERSSSRAIQPAEYRATLRVTRE